MGSRLESSGRLAEQGLGALYGLLRGLEGPEEESGQRLLFDERETDGRAIYDGLVSLVLGCVFVLSAEHRGLSQGPSIEAALHAERGCFRALLRVLQTAPIPGRAGPFDPFLSRFAARATLSDAAMQKLGPALLSLDGGHVHYGDLPVEHLGAVYEALIGFNVERATEPSLALSATVRPGCPPADPVVGLASLSKLEGADRSRHLADLGVELRGRALAALETAPSVEEISALLRKRASTFSPGFVQKGDWIVQPTEARRRSGSHYTPAALARSVVVRALSPLLEGFSERKILELRICDPAMGSGAFLGAACAELGDRLVGLRGQSQGDPRAVAAARRLTAERCLRGVDKDPIAVELAKLSLWLTVGDANAPLTSFDDALVEGDAVLAGASSFVWERDFATVLERRGGFDAFVGNPPWVSYAGRAAQPLDGAVRAHLGSSYRSFAGYKNLQGVFIERCASLLRPGGRLGLVIPSSMSEQAGYGPTRLAHDRLCACDQELPDMGEDSFSGVFQPCMVLYSTRREAPIELDVAERWPVERPDLDAETRAMVERMTSGPSLPPGLFGERGLQTSTQDLAHLADTPDARHDIPLRSGVDIRAFSRHPPSHHADRAHFGPRLRAKEEWERVAILIRQTAPHPIAVVSDGIGFRNSLLAGFEDAVYSRSFLVAYLNSTPIRWLHYVGHRDARQGMPQVKIGHLRAIPAPPRADLMPAVARIGEALSTANQGIGPDTQSDLDSLVSEMFALSPDEQRRLRAWAETMPPA